MRPLITTVKDGQSFVDEPVYAWPRPVSVMEQSLAHAFKRPLPAPVCIAYERVRLRWMKPDGRDGIVPR